MTDTSSFGLAIGICIIAVHLDVQSIPLFRHSFSYRSMRAYTSRCSHASVTALLHVLFRWSDWEILATAAPPRGC